LNLSFPVENTMAEIKVGARLASDVCDTEVMVIASGDPDTSVTCGGAAMIDAGADKSGASLDPDHSEGTQLGKRYVNEAGSIELLCVKAGEGALAVDGEMLVLKDAKPLPSSD
jgi:hypothetical protein